MSSLYICTVSDYHPYMCSHDTHCIHCTWGVFGDHRPDNCALCQDMGRLVKADYQHPVRVRDYSHRKLKVFVKTLANTPELAQKELPF
jgi:hypothetical protein